MPPVPPRSILVRLGGALVAWVQECLHPGQEALDEADLQQPFAPWLPRGENEDLVSWLGTRAGCSPWPTIHVNFPQRDGLRALWVDVVLASPTTTALPRSLPSRSRHILLL